MNSEENEEPIHEESPRYSIAEFLEGLAPNQLSNISDVSERKYVNGSGTCDIMRTPEIQLHCSSDACNGVRFFRCVSGQGKRLKEKYEFIYLTYKCSSCQNSEKTFSLAVKLDEEEGETGELYKFGELPPFGPPPPCLRS